MKKKIRLRNFQLKYQKFKKFISLSLSLLFFPFIYLFGWIIITLTIDIFPTLGSEKSLIGTIITFFLFLISFPLWTKYKWNKKFTQVVGFLYFKNKVLKYDLIIEFVKALSINCIILCLIIIQGSSKIIFNLNLYTLLNCLFLGILVGIAEELIFRAWLVEELSLFLNTKNSNFFQALVFSLAHLRFDYGILSNFQLLAGLFFLGLYLNNWRMKKYPTILSPVCFHGALVGIWFFINNTFLDIQPNVPNLLFGPGEGNDINPIGGFIGISLLVTLNIFNKNSHNNLSKI